MPADTYLSAEDVTAWSIPALPQAGADLNQPLFQALDDHGLMAPSQVAGRHWAMGCVALEITQRCNLDCTLCYLSDMSEDVKDLPLEEVFRRIDMIHTHYGPRTNVQITGGDPTLRNADELVQIVARVAAKDMRPALFTNGIKATRPLLKKLRDAGLKDVAFHIDMTQLRKGYDSEAELNTVREDYIDRARGLGLHILFNTTVFDQNIADVPMLAQFFAARADVVHLASFQMQADTGRGVLRARDEAITQERVMALIGQGAGHRLSFDHPLVGHPSCNRYAGLLSAGGQTTALFDDAALYGALFQLGARYRFDRYNMAKSVRSGAQLLLENPGLIARAARYGVRKLWALRRGLLKGRLHKLTFYVHNFMDAQHLERARCETCVFMTMTRDGPLSMCVHNANRDTFILAEIETSTGTWAPRRQMPAQQPLKRLKGRRRAAFLAQRKAPENHVSNAALKH